MRPDHQGIGSLAGILICCARGLVRGARHHAGRRRGGFGLSRSEAISMANAIQQTVKTSWKKVFRENRLATADIERLRNCFIACDSVIRDDQADDA